MSTPSDEPVTVLHIIVSDVTAPPLGATSALYAIPFQLSRTPSLRWSEFFLTTWDLPPRSNLRHRPGIARVEGDRIILDGTTMEEVKDLHRETLVLCVDAANVMEKEALEAQQAAEERRRRELEAHRKRVEDLSDDISFD